MSDIIPFRLTKLDLIIYSFSKECQDNNYPECIDNSWLSTKLTNDLQWRNIECCYAIFEVYRTQIKLQRKTVHL